MYQRRIHIFYVPNSIRSSHDPLVSQPTLLLYLVTTTGAPLELKLLAEKVAFRIPI